MKHIGIRPTCAEQHPSLACLLETFEFLPKFTQRWQIPSEGKVNVKYKIPSRHSILADGVWIQVVGFAKGTARRTPANSR